MKKLLSITAILSILCTSAHSMTPVMRALRPVAAATAVMYIARSTHAEETPQDKAMAQARAAFNAGVDKNIRWPALCDFEQCIRNSIPADPNQYITHPQCYGREGDRSGGWLNQEHPSSSWFKKNTALEAAKKERFEKLQKKECEELYYRGHLNAKPRPGEDVRHAGCAVGDFRHKMSNTPQDFYKFGGIVGLWHKAYDAKYHLNSASDAYDTFNVTWNALNQKTSQ